MQGTEEVRDALEAGEPVLSLASLIEVALDDAEGLDRGRYTADSGVWHSQFEAPDCSRVCRVCFGGAVIAGTLGQDWLASLNPTRLNNENVSRALYALDKAREGRWAYAYMLLTGTLKTDALLKDVEWPPKPFCRNFADWYAFETFAEDMRAAVPVLRATEAKIFANVECSECGAETPNPYGLDFKLCARCAELQPAGPHYGPPEHIPA